MRKIQLSLGSVAGAFSNGSETERWFIDEKNGRVFLISSEYQTDEAVEQAVDMINKNRDNFIPLPYMTDEDFLAEVDVYSSTVSSKPALAKLLEMAVAEKYSKGQVMQVLNRDPGQKTEFGEFYSKRVQERVKSWLKYMEIELID